MNYHDFFSGKKVTLMGLGLLGRGVGDAQFLLEQGAEVLVTDTKTESELSESLAQLEGEKNVSFRLGGHDTLDFIDTDMVIKGAGVPLNSTYITDAKRAGIPVYMSTALAAQFAREMGVKIVGVTGTRGKSTVTQMIVHVLKQSGHRAHVGGNVRGVSTLALLPQLKKGDILVLELDSWQLQGFGDLKISPDVSVFTNLMPDHQNYYLNLDVYFEDKAKIFSHQKSSDIFICARGIFEKVKAAHPPVVPRIPAPLPDSWVVRVPGMHNRENAAFAVEALRALGVSEEEIQKGLESFEGVEGRLQFVKEIRGIKIYNDNNSTTPEATIAALKALDHEKKNIILIAGGSDKGLDMSALLYEIAHTCKRVILLAGKGTDRVVPFMQDYSIFDSLEAAVHEAVRAAQPGDVVLFSPAFASFGMFKNEYERNDRFLQIMKDVT